MQILIDTQISKPQLKLDPESLDPAILSMGALMREINLHKHPPYLLRFMMNALENKRQKKLLGWSRPWNKMGVNVFRTHIHDLNLDQHLLTQMKTFFWKYSETMPDHFKKFAMNFFEDPLLMAFTFYHNHTVGEKEYEGFTFSLGRKLPHDKSKRDRIDFIFEDLREEGRVDHRPELIRIVVNPYLEWTQNQRYEKILKADQIDDLDCKLYQNAIQFYNEHRDVPERQWNHWASRYIDYFGPRSFIPVGSAFV